jgi:hypothetical protein
MQEMRAQPLKIKKRMKLMIFTSQRLNQLRILISLGVQTKRSYKIQVDPASILQHGMMILIRTKKKEMMILQISIRKKLESRNNLNLEKPKTRPQVVSEALKVKRTVLMKMKVTMMTSLQSRQRLNQEVLMTKKRMMNLRKK